MVWFRPQALEPSEHDFKPLLCLWTAVWPWARTLNALLYTLLKDDNQQQIFNLSFVSVCGRNFLPFSAFPLSLGTYEYIISVHFQPALKSWWVVETEFCPTECGSKWHTQIAGVAIIIPMILLAHSFHCSHTHQWRLVMGAAGSLSYKLEENPQDSHSTSTLDFCLSKK